MDGTLSSDTVWYHGSNILFKELRQGSTITTLRALAEAFSHKPSLLCIEDDGSIAHNGTEAGYLYAIAEELSAEDVFPHPNSTMEPGMEYLTRRPLKVRLLCELDAGGTD